MSVAASSRSDTISRSSLGEEVYRVLWQRILDRRLRPGEKLSDLRLSDELSVSRTPVREALQRLVRDGIARSEPNHGFYVTSFSETDIAEIYDLRSILESAALSRAIPHLPEAGLKRELVDLDTLEQKLLSPVNEVERLHAVNEFLEVDRRFHRWIASHSGNSRLFATMEGLWGQIAVFQQAGGFRPDLPIKSVVQHREIISALLAHDASLALERLEQHIQDVKARAIHDFAVFGSDGELALEELSAHES